MGSGDDLELPPHLFSVAAAGYTAMLSDARNQSIIISGESGAGKTEATKRILTYFANLQRSSSGEAGKDRMSIEEQVLRSNPILEAFGNAKTIRNDNSSRFGKFIDIEFDTTGKLQSARISNYLLEKSRIVTQQPDERGYHAFYQLCAGAANVPGIGSTLGLRAAFDHAYTSVCTTIPGVDDKEGFEEMAECMISLGFSSDERESIFKLGAAVLHLGDMQFQEGGDGSTICDASLTAKICELLHVEEKNFTKIFQYKTLEDPFTKKTIDMPQDPTGSSNTRHSMAKTLYSRLFDWLVWRINQSTAGKGAAGNKKDTKKIGILDIYGFEVFDWNSFEQLCINFANEKLQQHFNSHMFTLEQQLYTEEGITWSHIQWQDNQMIIDNLEKKPLGLFCILDSECLMPNATDQTCLSKIYNSFKTSKIVYKPSRFASTNFAVAHYAGEVVYDVVSFLEKNTDKLHADIMNLMKTSSLSMARLLFTDPRFAPELQAAAASPANRGAAAPRRGADSSGQRAKQNVTVSMMFREQLNQLVDDLNRTNPRYIRCIKPNPNKQAHEMDSLDVQRQLRCAGMLESIRIRRAGYSVRRPFKEFFNRFRILCPHVSTGGSLDPDYKELCRKILTDMEARFEAQKQPLEPKSWQVGRSKVFLKEELQGRLEKSIGDAIKVYVIRVQKRWRGFVALRRFRAMRKAASQVQASLRALRAVVEYQELLQRSRACVSVQATLRMLVQRSQLLQKKSAAVTIQKRYRGWACRRKVGKLKGKMAADRIQKMREEEERKTALDAAKQAAHEKEKALADMQKQFAEERERAQREAEQKMEEERQKMAKVRAEQDDAEKARQKEQQDAGQLEQLRKELLDMRKENARLQGQLDAQPAQTGMSAADAADLEAARRELQETRREKVRLEVELATSKTSDEYAALQEEMTQLREECSALRRSKLDTELQLEQRSAQCAAAEEKSSRLEADSLELTVLKSSHDELQIQVQRLEAQKVSLEERAQADGALRNELRELRLEKIRLEGELDTSKLREEAMSEKLKGSGQSNSELQQLRSKVTSAEADLEQSRKQVEMLRQQMSQQSQEMGSDRANSLDNLRNELLSRIEASRGLDMTRSTVADIPSARPSILPGEEDGRKTLMNQREIFEKLKQQFNDAASPSAKDDAEPAMSSYGLGNGDRELELEEELRRVRKENVELNLKLASVQDELTQKSLEATHLLGDSSGTRAELEDIKLQLEQEGSAARRHAARADELQASLQVAEAELPAMRERLTSLREQLVQAEEESSAAKHRCVRLEEEHGLLEQRLQQMQAQAAGIAQRERAAAAQVEEQHQLAEDLRRATEAAERGRAESESSRRWLESENERLKVELVDANSERAKIRQVVDELLNAQQNSRSDEMLAEIERWKRKAAHFEKEYTNAKQLNGEMTKVMSQMTQRVSERSDETGDVSKQNKILQKQLEMKSQELRSAKADRDDVQRQLDTLESQGSYYKDKHREAQDEMRTLRQEHSVAMATSSKLKARLESIQQELEDAKVQRSQLQAQTKSNLEDSVRLDSFGSQVQELTTKLRSKDLELSRSQAYAAKSQAVNDCLNTLLVLETEQTSLYEKACPIVDEALASQFAAKKAKAQGVIGRLNEIMGEQERLLS
eukprot:TRINITY_DN5007_c0_g4_i1.p1 TRINITY_DN5007_c0_g4~~TRINITY_DN5007_c0_g4_i1.p1  ORF type:complete len:1783 (-),score=512.44 TRINITY_DN5007_c0_g4_i1:78-4991(-)